MNIIQMLVPDAYVFTGAWGYTRRYLVLHKTAGFHTAQEVAAYFQSGSNGLEVSSHYVVGPDGAVVQCVREADGAGANGVLEAGHDAWWDASINPNLITFSIEHVDPASDNSTPVTAAQQAASFALIHDICQRWNIPMRAADANGGITGHYSIDPQSRAHCPGNYPWTALWAYLKGQNTMIPQNWHDDGTTLTAPNGIHVVKGFRDYVLAFPGGWDAGNWPLEAEQALSMVELANHSGPGSRQIFRFFMLCWYADRGVVTAWTGHELYAWIAQSTAQAKQITTLEAQLKAAQTPVVPQSINVAAAIAATQSVSSTLVVLAKDMAGLKTALGVS